GSMSRDTCWPLMLIVTSMSGLLVESSLGGAAQRPLGQNAREVALVVHRTATVGAGGAVLGCDLPGLLEQGLRRRLAGQELLGAAEVDGGEPDGAERDPHLGDRGRVDPERRGCGRDRPVAGPALDLLVRAARAREERQPDLGEQLAVAHGG